MKSGYLIHILFHILIIVSFATANPIAYCFLGILFLLIIWKYYKNTILNKQEYLIFLTYLVVLIFGTLINLITNPIVLFHFSLSLLCLISSFILTRVPNIYYLSSKTSLILFQIFCLMYVYYKGLANFPVIVPFENMIEGASANGITSYMVLFQINYLFINYLLYKKTTFYTSIITLIIALIGYGRGSIIAAFIVLLMCGLGHFMKRNIRRILFYCLAFTILTVITTIYFSENILFFLEANTKLSAGLVDEARAKILSDYISKLNFITIFTGSEYPTSVMNQFRGNPHNSFIRAHHIFGLPYLIFATLLPFFLILKLRNLKNIIFFSLLILTLYFRAFSEPIIFATLLDFYFLSMCFLLIKSYNTSRSSNAMATT